MQPNHHRSSARAPGYRSTAATMLAAVLCALLVSACRGTLPPRTLPRAGDQLGYPTVSASQAYAGAVLGHMMAVVTGAGGKIENRAKWRTRGLDVPLRFQEIRQIMSDPERDKSRLLVYDAEIIGLSRVLYHYDPRLNQFKGRLPFASPFPSEELIALRLLLIGKIARGETIRLEAVIDRLPAIRDNGRHLPPGDLFAMGLSAEEALLLSEAIQSEPAIADYMRHPSVAAAMARMGVLAGGTIERTTLLASVPTAPARTASTLALIGMLPSFETDFAPVENGGKQVLAATAGYLARTAALRAKIVSASGAMAKDGYRLAHPDSPPPPEDRWQAQWRAFADSRIVFFIPDTAPLAITPVNAQGLTAIVCPEADLNIILVGKDVVRSMDIRPERDEFPQTNRFFLDADDVKYGFAGESIGRISRWVVEKTAPAFYRQWAADAS